MTKSNEPALRFSREPQHPNNIGNMMLHFRERGYAVLPDVFERDSVDAYRAQLVDNLEETGQFWTPYRLPGDSPLMVAPARAPQLREGLRLCYAPSVTSVQPVLFQPAWVIRPARTDGAQTKLAHDWHKDGDHGCISCANGYQSPNVVHAVMYFEDMTPEHGPTYLLPGSHRDGRISPYPPGVEERETPMLPRKQDAVLWDQRTWHRGSERTLPGYRIVAIFAFFFVPAVNKPMERSAAQRNAARSEDPSEQILFGGPFQAD